MEIGREAMFLAVMQHDSKISPVLCNHIPIYVVLLASPHGVFLKNSLRHSFSEILGVNFMCGSCAYYSLASADQSRF